ncbi:hypothetical protein [Flavobacterium aquidurense]|uniref:Lipoprotein n=1 Tax=Flavobacterium aquidurense TaxID=362413 RepID=A0A0Q0S2V1_9FLAO|nr:hypothetical protein [Flavobacterium aquidurense]KQB37712.1 hypothetical protein RC62_2878 [Flavobacterium aquidurense]
MRLYFIFIILVMYSCSKNEGNVELEIVSDEILFSKLDTGRAKNIIEYKITNKTDCDYYFNACSFSKLTWKIDGLQPSNVFLQILDDKGIQAEYGRKEYLPIEKASVCEQINYDIKEKEIKELNYSIAPDYKDLIDKNNFLLKRGESKYFEILYYFPESNYSFVHLYKNKKYVFKMLIYSDSTDYMKFLPRPILKTINENKYKVYHGIIESKNNVPVRFVN